MYNIFLTNSQLNMLGWTFIGLIITFFGLYQPKVIQLLHLQNNTSKLKTLRLYIIHLGIFFLFLIGMVYVNSYIATLDHLLFPFSTVLLLITAVFGIKIGIITFLVTTPLIYFHLIQPFSLQTNSILNTDFISTAISQLFGLFTGEFIRMYHRILGRRLDELQERYWQTRSKLASTTNEQQILQAIDKASLVVASIEEHSLDKVLAISAEEVQQLLEVNHVGIGLINDNNFVPSIVMKDNKPITMGGENNSVLMQIISKVLQSKRLSPVVIDVPQASKLLGNRKIYFSFDKVLIVPVSAHNTILGGIFVTNYKEKITFTNMDIKKISMFASHAALAVQNAKRLEELQTLIRMRDQFASVASHELKTPLSAIKLYTQLLQNKLSDNTDVTIENSLSTINKEANKLTTLINTLLDFSRLQTNKFILDRKKFSLVEMCQQSIMVMQALHPSHTFELKTSLHSAPIMADRVRIEQVITNLLTNAARYSPANTKITLQIAKKNNKYILSVKDQGLGIDEVTQKYIFEPFYQSRENIESGKGIQGLGLGLYISHEIIDKHEGQLWVESKKGIGSIFHISLPVKHTS